MELLSVLALLLALLLLLLWIPDVQRLRGGAVRPAHRLHRHGDVNVAVHELRRQQRLQHLLLGAGGELLHARLQRGAFLVLLGAGGLQRVAERLLRDGDVGDALLLRRRVDRDGPRLARRARDGARRAVELPAVHRQQVGPDGHVALLLLPLLGDGQQRGHLLAGVRHGQGHVHLALLGRLQDGGEGGRPPRHHLPGGALLLLLHGGVRVYGLDLDLLAVGQLDVLSVLELDVVPVLQLKVLAVLQLDVLAVLQLKVLPVQLDVLAVVQLDMLSVLDLDVLSVGQLDMVSVLELDLMSVV